MPRAICKDNGAAGTDSLDYSVVSRFDALQKVGKIVCELLQEEVGRKIIGFAARRVLCLPNVMEDVFLVLRKELSLVAAINVRLQEGRNSKLGDLLKRVNVPLSDLPDRRHLRQLVRQVI